jgi:hypothetical protein
VAAARAWQVLHAIDDALEAQYHHPRLFAEHLKHGKSCLSVARAIARYKIARPIPTRDDSYNGDELAERVDAAWEEQHARRREERFAKRRLSFDAARRQARAKMTMLELAIAVHEGVSRLSTVPAGSVERSRGGGDGELPKQQTLDDDPRWQEHEAVARRRLGAMLDLVEEAEGLGAIANPTMDGDDKDRLILHHSMEGKTASQVWDELGTYVAGSSPELVRRKRRAKGLDMLGRPREDAAVSSNRRRSET